MALTENQQTPKGTLLQRILIEGREHWSQPGYDPDCALRFLRAVQCKTAELGRRVYASESEVAVFCNTCKSPACTGCGHWSTIQWQRERWCALPEGPYRVITLTMPNTLWPLFSSNPRLCRKLAEIAARVIVGYARVRRGVEVGGWPYVGPTHRSRLPIRFLTLKATFGSRFWISLGRQQRRALMFTPVRNSCSMSWHALTMSRTAA